ncbi:bifunctional hydroxymethylpyrimidine kinase/phosphomethylpyrimidine kinase [Silvanigrella aquatica]|uniref:hydroxymethylpyrimidine kinase n=1 Tax=Silvanigrella aquatica TaxID=1915309 RepID=A0A1L4D1C0_9BACT|nr:bifunctional hydroxymethylpyrimidine kinase/phosphomethylpyrimidine kinase [Silvanigrella aquatica]APJ03991.1 bifunctional hydroxymethylpyrimidine kinase/phosphomethylpyrimidine kinase [Silvanigrella aquatica]
MTGNAVTKNYSCVLTIAGSDSGGGAGVQADLKTFHEHQCYGASVITAVTAQNTLGVFDIHEIPVQSIASQLDCVLSDIRFNAIKIGMLFSVDIILLVCEKLKKYECKNIVLDPVILSKNNYKLLKDDALTCLRDHLFPLAKMITPNLPEAELLLSRKISTLHEMENAALEMWNWGSDAVIIKGGHLLDHHKCSDCLIYGERHYKKIKWLDSKKILTCNTHGTGCTFSAALAANLAKGYDIEESFQLSKQYISQAIAFGSQFKLGHGIGSVCHFKI